MPEAPRLLVVWHSASGGTRDLVEAAVEGATDPMIAEALGSAVDVRVMGAFEAGVEDVMAADGYLLATPENFGYMSGALKDFFDRTYYPCLEHTRGRPYGLLVKAGGDGLGAVGAVVPLAAGLEWRAVLEPLVVRGDVTADHLAAARELGGSLAAGLAGDLW
jgi:NAD(P)H-dependent FMN reductase